MIGSVLNRRIDWLLVLMLSISAVAHGCLLLFSWSEQGETDDPATVAIELGSFVVSPEQTLPVTTGTVAVSGKVPAPFPEVQLPVVRSSTRPTVTAAEHSPEHISRQVVPQKIVTLSSAGQKRPVQPGQQETQKVSAVSDVKKVVAAPAAESMVAAVRPGDITQAGAGENSRALLVEGRLRHDEYMRNLLRKIVSRKRYPYRARTRHLEGKTVVAFTLLGDGSIEQASLVKSAGSTILDRSALRAVRAASPFARPPQNIIFTPVRLEVVLSFELL
ncbi:energy transducer TonB [Desulforhopalus singaporensis]|uniref:TonB family C-terminal domain-containing protein n=1 Tax=Desulforhopalus singaporensis TaxID=91360 RepID=A0A1H0RKS7_9BACT|nr:energy transducer TonB [Desulforhopalus singaporensis]SDP30071.1 TonB family C-terminal domain-containing protein [Desulforhopalus singaporensis]